MAPKYPIKADVFIYLGHQTRREKFNKKFLLYKFNDTIHIQDEDSSGEYTFKIFEKERKMYIHKTVTKIKNNNGDLLELVSGSGEASSDSIILTTYDNDKIPITKIYFDLKNDYETRTNFKDFFRFI